MQQTLKDIFAVRPVTLVLSLLATIGLHYYLLEAAIRRTAAADAAAAQDFWATGLVNALPYLRTENTALKFLTFFVLAYAIVWLCSLLIKTLEHLQRFLIKQLRRTT